MKSSAGRVALQLGQQLEHRGLHRDVERGRDLVADQQVGLRPPARARSRPAGARRPRARRDSASAMRARAAAPARAARATSARRRLRRSRPRSTRGGPARSRRDAVPRVERLVRVLEDDLDPAARVERPAARRARRAAGRRARSVPTPARAGRRRSARSVVLPLPDSPTSATHSPRRDLRTRRRGHDGRGPPRPDARRAAPSTSSSGRPAARRPATRGRSAARPAAAPLPARSSAPRGHRRLGSSAGAPARSASACAAGSAARTRSRPAIRRRRPRRRGCPAARAARRRSGIAATSARVYGWRGPRDDVGGRALLDDAAGVHDDDPVGDLGDHREVVRDVDHRHARARRAAGRAPSRMRAWVSTSRPGRRLVEHDDRRARRRRPWRSSRAAAGRRRAGAGSGARKPASRGSSTRASAAARRVSAGPAAACSAATSRDRVADPHARG